MHSPNFKSVSIFLLVFLCLSPLFGTSLSFAQAFLFLTCVILLSFYYFTKSKYIVLSHFLWILALTIVGLFVLANSRSLAISYYAYLLFITIFIFSLIVSPAVNLAKLKNLLILSTTIYIVPFLAFKSGLFGLIASADGDDFIFQTWGKSHLAELIIFIFPLVIQKFSGNKKYLALLAIFLPILYLTNSRSAIFALILGLIYLLKNNYQRLPKLLFPLLIVLPISFFILQFSVENKLLAYKSPTGARFEYWQQAFLFFKQSPFLGNGQNTFFIANKLWQTTQGAISTNNPHNLTLKLLSESGIIFTLFFYLGFLYLWKNSTDIYAKTSVLIVFIESHLGTSLSNIGLQILTLVFLLNTQPRSPVFKIKTVVLVPFLLLMFITSLSRLSSDLAFFSKNYQLGMALDPFNINSLYASLKESPSKSKNVDKIVRLGFHNYEVYKFLLDIGATTIANNHTSLFLMYQELNPMQVNPKDYIEPLIFSVIKRDYTKATEILHAYDTRFPDHLIREEKNRLIAFIPKNKQTTKLLLRLIGDFYLKYNFSVIEEISTYEDADPYLADKIDALANSDNNINRQSTKMAKFLYKTSLQNIENSLRYKYLEGATKLATNWSYFYLEYANLLFQTGKDYSLPIKKCLNNHYAKDACKSYAPHIFGSEERQINLIN